MSQATVSSPLRHIIRGLSYFSLTCAVGVFGYVIAGWPVMDAVYMVVITIFGVGYGEVRPILSPGLRGMTIGLIVFGYAATIYTVGGFVQMVMEGELNRALNRRRMTKGIGELNGHTILCGMGRAGRILAAELAASKEPFVIVDQDPTKLSEAEALGYLVLEGNATEDDTLRDAGIDRARALATVLPDDSANVFITLTARELNPTVQIIARAENPQTEKKLLRSGANKVVLPAVIGGQRMAHLILRPSTEQILNSQHGADGLQDELSKLSLRVDDLRIAPGTVLDGQTVGNIDLGGNRGFLIVAVRKADGSVIASPDDSCPLAAGDAVVVLGRPGDLPKLARRYTETKTMYYRGSKV